MIRSRVTLATTEAAAIVKLSVSPLTTVFTAQDSGGAILPSTSAMSGATPSAATARAIALRLARRILMRSISATLAAPMPIRGARAPAAARHSRPRAARGSAASNRRDPANSRGKQRAVDNHRRGDDRAGKRPAPGLVDAAHHAAAAILDGEIRHAILPAPQRLCHRGGPVARQACARRHTRIKTRNKPVDWSRRRLYT